jgi:hypothetical protein
MIARGSNLFSNFEMDQWRLLTQKKVADVSAIFRCLDFSIRFASPAGITIPVCGTHKVPATIIAGTVIGVAAVVVIRWGIPAVSVSRWIDTAIVAVPRSAIVTVPGAIAVRN